MSSGISAIRKGERLDVESIREDFPILRQSIGGHPLIYLDNAATAQKPQAVLDALNHFYQADNSNIHRGVHQLSQRATEAYESARIRIQRFINAADWKEIIFVRGATEGINLVAASYGRTHVGPGDEVLISAMEHHSNIVPWQMLCEEKGARLRVLPMNSAGELRMEELDRCLTDRTRLVAVVHVSNALGTLNPVRRIITAAHDRGIPVLIDAAQSAPHLKLDVRALDCDFLVFSGHKLFGPTGVGILYGKAELLDGMPPFQGGGDMIRTVTFEKTTYNSIPYKFEAGTPNIAGGIGLGAAADYLSGIGLDLITAYESDLLEYTSESLAGIDSLRIIGTAASKASVTSFSLADIHPHDIGTILDQEGIAIRTGHHCAQPVMDFYHVPATARVSLAFYNTREEIDALAAGLKKVLKIFG